MNISENVFDHSATTDVLICTQLDRVLSKVIKYYLSRVTQKGHKGLSKVYFAVF